MADDRVGVKIGIIGGTGHEGSGLALRFAHAGFSVAIGSRSEPKALGRAHELAVALRTAGRSANLTGMANSEVPAFADVLFLTVPFGSAPDTVAGLSFPPGKILVDTTVPVPFTGGRPSLVSVEEGSSSQRIARLLPATVRLVAAFKTIPARLLFDVDTALDCDVFVCGDEAEARSEVMRLCEVLPGLRAVDAGKLVNAATIERMSALAIELNLRYKVKYNRWRLVGLEQ
jgi:NADPH-dependent F420 reductase